ncbi:MAG: MFS transporter [Anaerolineae bacterium]|nr:MFS transporter [Anaerolineae bacterium]
MHLSLRDRFKAATSMWSTYVLTLAFTVFLMSLGSGLLNAASTNFFVNDLGLSGAQVLWLAGIREIPGLLLVFIAALLMRLPLSRRAVLSIIVMGVGYCLYAAIQSYVALLAAAVFSSLGFHNWLPLQGTLGFALTEKRHSGRIMGFLSSIGALASIVGMGLTALLATALPLRAFFIVGGVLIVLGGVLVLRIPANIGEQKQAQPRILLKKRYWLYYVLTFFEGSRTQVFGSFGTLVLVQSYGLNAQQISLLLVTSGIVNFVFAPAIGRLLDLVGERFTLTISYVLLALCFVGYATVHNVWFLCGMLIGINLLVTLSIGLSTYVNRIAPPEELGPTLSAGVSINHITSVTMSLLAGTLLGLIGYEKLCWGAAGVITLSVPFALAIKVAAAPVMEAQVA